MSWHEDRDSFVEELRDHDRMEREYDEDVWLDNPGRGQWGGMYPSKPERYEYEDLER